MLSTSETFGKLRKSSGGDAGELSNRDVQNCYYDFFEIYGSLFCYGPLVENIIFGFISVCKVVFFGVICNAKGLILLCLLNVGNFVKGLSF